MITLQNTTVGDFNLPTVGRLAANGSKNVDEIEYKALCDLDAFNALLNSGRVIATGPLPDVGPKPNGADKIHDREALIARAEELGISVNPRWKDGTIAAKIAEAEASEV